MFKLIYIFFEKDLGKVRNYLEKNLKKCFIKKFQLLIRYSILFLSKKNETFNLYIDY